MRFAEFDNNQIGNQNGILNKNEIESSNGNTNQKRQTFFATSYHEVKRAK